jgi:hypothetical protein
MVKRSRRRNAPFFDGRSSFRRRFPTLRAEKKVVAIGTRSLMATAVLLASLVFPDGADAWDLRTVVVRVHNSARIPLNEVRIAHQHVEQVYRAIDVRLVWADANAAIEPGADVVLDVLFLSAEMTKRVGPVNTRALAVAVRAARRAYVFYPRVVAAAMKGVTPFEEVLGHVVAHELGHLLLPEGGHASRGVMREDFEAGRLSRGGAFSLEQRDQIHASLAASRGQPSASR